jgi:uncharacterized protein
MSADRIPLKNNSQDEADASVLARPLMCLAGWSMRHPFLVLSIALFFGVFSVVWAAERLGFRTSRIDLINPNNVHNQRYLKFIEEFGEESEIVVVVEGDSREAIIPILNEISENLAAHPEYYQAVLHKLDFTKIRAKGLYYATEEELASIESFVSQTEPIVQGRWEGLSLSGTLGYMDQRLAAHATTPSPADYHGAVDELDRLSSSLMNAIRPPRHYESPWPSEMQSPWPEMPGQAAVVSDLQSSYLLTDQGRTGFVFLQLAKIDKSQLAQGAEAIDSLRAMIATISLKHEGVKAGLTGLPIMENDEMRMSQDAMMKASVLSLLGVSCLFVAGLGGLRHPLMTVCALLIGIAWTFGYITLAVGHLNILSVSFGVILIGLGIDFGIHYVARYLQLRGEHPDCGDCIVQAAGSVGPGILTGAVTTSIAFFTAGLTEFTGVAELGIIAGGGILLCCVAALFLLPAMLSLSDGRRVMKTQPMPLDVHAWLAPLFRRPEITLVACCLGTLLIAFGTAHVWYDHNLLNLQPEGLESVELERKLLNDYAQSVTYAVSTSNNREELLERRELFAALDSVASTPELASVIPPDGEAKRPVVTRIFMSLQNLPERPGVIPEPSPELIGLQLAGLQMRLERDAASLELSRKLDALRDMLRRMPTEECVTELSRFQFSMAGDLLSRLHTLREIAAPVPPEWSDLPEGLVARFVGANGSYLLKVHPKGDIWNMDELEDFVDEVRSVDPHVTGTPIQTFEASRSMRKSYEKSAMYALLAIVVLLLLDFRDIRYVLLAMLPLGAGMIQMFGLLGALGIPLNPANMIVLPLILGIGVDDGVHVVHDFRRQRGPYHMSPSTASSVLITSLTTMVGFGSLMIASHRGLQSLGRVLTIGVSCCLFTSIIMLPALLRWVTRYRAYEDLEDESLASGRNPDSTEHVELDAELASNDAKRKLELLESLEQNVTNTEPFSSLRCDVNSSGEDLCERPSRTDWEEWGRLASEHVERGERNTEEDDVEPADEAE